MMKSGDGPSLLKFLRKCHENFALQVIKGSSVSWSAINHHLCIRLANIICTLKKLSKASFNLLTRAKFNTIKMVMFRNFV